MTTLVRNIFSIAMTMMATLIIFNMFFGDTGRSVIWSALEPVFQDTWKRVTMEDGSVISSALTTNFDELEEVQ